MVNYLIDGVEHDGCRNNLIDYCDSLVFNCDSTSQVSFNDLKYCEIINLPSKCVDGDINFNMLHYCTYFTFPRMCRGSEWLSKLENVDNYKFSDCVLGNLYLPYVQCVNSCVMPRLIGSSCYLNSLTNSFNSKFSDYIFANLDVSQTKQLSNANFSHTIVHGNAFFNWVIEAKNVIFPKEVDFNFDISSLRDVENVIFPEKVAGFVIVNNDFNVEILPEYLWKNVITVSEYKTKVEPYFYFDSANHLVIQKSKPDLDTEKIKNVNSDLEAVSDYLKDFALECRIPFELRYLIIDEDKYKENYDSIVKYTKDDIEKIYQEYYDNLPFIRQHKKDTL